MTKVCTKCKTEKTLDQFYRDKSIKCGRRAACKQCCYEDRKEYLAEYFQNNKLRLQSLSTAWKRANPEKVKQYYHTRYLKNRENEILRVSRYHSENRDRVNAAHKKWRAANPKKVASYKAKRRANATDNFTANELNKLFKKCDNRCLACGSIENLTVDHIVPLSRGGSNLIDNIQPLCLSCNCSKGTKIIDYRSAEWLAQ